MIHYTESTAGVSLTDTNLTGKMGFGFAGLTGPVFDLSAYRTVTSLNHRPAAVKPMTFLGVNARAGFRMGKNVTVYSGLYYWSATVPDHSYGVSSAFGPQFFLDLHNDASGFRRKDIYVKYALLGRQASSQREIAAGAGFQLNSPRAETRIDLTLDVAQIKYLSSSGQFNLKSYSVGLRIAH